MALRLWICMLLGLLLAAPALAKERTWTNVDGFEMKAEFVREVDGVVTFLKDGKLITLPLDKLSEKDQQIIRDLAMGKPLPEDEEGEAPANAEGASPAASEPETTAEEAKPAGSHVTIEERTWTDTSGKKIYAKFVRVVGSEVVLIRTNKVVRIPFHTLSDSDQKYVRDILTRQGKADQIPGGQSGDIAGGDDGSPGENAGGGASGAGGRSVPIARGKGGSFIPSTPGIPPLPGAQGTGGRPTGGVTGPPGVGRQAPPTAGASPVVPRGGYPGAGRPGIGSDGQYPGAGGNAGSSLPTGPPEDPALAPTGIPDEEPGLAGTGPMPGPTAPGMIPTGVNPPGFGPGMDPSAGPSFPASPPTPDFPGMASTNPAIPTGPTFKQVYQCTGCKREITEAESSLAKCPHCGTLWLYKDDGAGNKQYSGVASARSMAVGLLVVVGIIVLGAVGGFIGIIAAIVRSACKPPSHSNYRRY